MSLADLLMSLRRRPGPKVPPAAALDLAVACACEPLESGILLSTFKLYVAGHRHSNDDGSTTIDIYSTGEAINSLTVTWPDGHVDHPTVSTPITTDTYTITGGLTGEQTVSVSGTSVNSHNASATWALDSDFGNFPGSGGGENVFTPTNSTATTNYGVVVDTAHSDNVYTFESVTPSGGTNRFAITKTS